jgi:hypothetical protein
MDAGQLVAITLGVICGAILLIGAAFGIYTVAGRKTRGEGDKANDVCAGAEVLTVTDKPRNHRIAAPIGRCDPASDQ